MSFEIRQGHVLDRLAEIPDRTVQCVITSPPYYGLRDYGTGEWKGGDPACTHTRLNPRQDHSHGAWRDTRDQQAASIAGASPMRSICARCGAERVDRQIGLEATPDEFVQTMVAVFREVRRVLRDDGTVWLNLGDSYNNRTKVRSSSHQPALNGFKDDNWAERALRGGVRMSHLSDALKEKDLFGIPWLVAFALRADGWYLRSDIIWSKPNPMPESVIDRPSSAHEHLFLLAKSRRYYYDADAIRVPHAAKTLTTVGTVRHDLGGGDLVKSHNWARDVPERRLDPRGANKRNVWTIATQPYPEAHFATFPTQLVTVGWEPSCDHTDDTGRSLAGPGERVEHTVGVVCRWHGRDFIGIDLNADYCQMARRRIQVEGSPARRTGRPPDPIPGQLDLLESV